MEEQIVKNITEKQGRFQKGSIPWNKGKIKLDRQTKKQEYQKNEKKYWERNIKKKYNLTKEEYNELYVKQRKVCAICKIKTNYRLTVDHNHKTGKIRELLCYNCNSAIGKFNEDVTLIKKAIKYLEKHNGRKN